MTSVVRSVVTCQADADVSLPSPPNVSFSLTLSSSFSLPPFYPSSPPFSALTPFSYLCLLPLAMQPADAIRSASLPPSLSSLFSLSLSLPRGRPRAMSLLGLTYAIVPAPIHAPTLLLALFLAGIFSLLPHPPPLVFSFSLCQQLPSSTLSRLISLVSAVVPMACSRPFFSRSISDSSQKSRRTRRASPSHSSLSRARWL